MNRLLVYFMLFLGCLTLIEGLSSFENIHKSNVFPTIMSIPLDKKLHSIHTVNKIVNSNNYIFPTTPISIRISIIAKNNTTICEGDSVELFTQYVNGLFYQWYVITDPKNGTMAPIPGENSISFFATKSGEYLLMLTDANGNNCTSNSIIVTVNPSPVISILASGNLNFCPGGNVLLTAVTDPFSMFLWSNGSSHQTISVNTSGSFYVTVTNQKTGCSAVSSTVYTALHNLRTDINADGITDYADYLLLMQQFNNTCSNCNEDIDLDGIVKNEDFLKLLGDYTLSCY